MSPHRRGGGASPDSDPPASPSAVSIIGLGASGLAAARLALSHGETIYVSDLRTDARLEAAADELRELGARVDLGRHDVERIAEAACVVVSPGIPPHAPVLDALRSRGVAWIGEPEFALRFHSGALIAVTGTNGKTTTAMLIAHLLRTAGKNVELGGNVGGGLAPAASEVLLNAPSPDWLVLEMSSFQLADTQDFAPDIGVVTSLAPDHLDRYPSVAAYHADKARLFRNAGPGSRWVLNGENPAVEALAGNAPGRRYRYRIEPPSPPATGEPPVAGGPPRAPRPSAYVEAGVLTLHLEPGLPEPLLAAGDLRVLGRHNLLNALGGALAARLAGVAPDLLRTGLRSFRPLPHRMEPVGEIEGVLWINDSKATNVEAARAAIESLDRTVVVLLGGKDKGEDFTPLATSLDRGTRAAVLYGEASGRLESVLGSGRGAEPQYRLIRVDRGFDEAVAAASRACVRGDALLLAPACSSFDLFENYEARGRRFTEIARTAGAGAVVPGATGTVGSSPVPEPGVSDEGATG